MKTHPFCGFIGDEAKLHYTPSEQVHVPRKSHTKGPGHVSDSQHMTGHSWQALCSQGLGRSWRTELRACYLRSSLSNYRQETHGDPARRFLHGLDEALSRSCLYFFFKSHFFLATQNIGFEDGEACVLDGSLWGNNSLSRTVITIIRNDCDLVGRHGSALRQLRLKIKQCRKSVWL